MERRNALKTLFGGAIAAALAPAAAIAGRPKAKKAKKIEQAAPPRTTADQPKNEPKFDELVMLWATRIRQHMEDGLRETALDELASLQMSPYDSLYHYVYGMLDTGTNRLPSHMELHDRRFALGAGKAKAFNSSVTPEQFLVEAKAVARELLAGTAEHRDKFLESLRKQNPTLCALVRNEIDLMFKEHMAGLASGYPVHLALTGTSDTTHSFTARLTV